MQHPCIILLFVLSMLSLGGVSASDESEVLTPAPLTNPRIHSPTKHPEDYAIRQLVKGDLHPAVESVHSLLERVRAQHLREGRFTQEFLRAAVDCVYGDHNRTWRSMIASMPLRPLSVGGIYKTFIMSSRETPIGTSLFYCVEGAADRFVETSPLARGGICQVPARFNFESSSKESLRGLTSLIVRDYWARNFFNTATHQPLFMDLPLSAYYNGSLKPSHLSYSQRSALMAQLRTLRILGQWVQPEGAAHQVLQVLIAAPSFAGVAKPDRDGLCEQIIANQYRAIAQLAVLRCLETGDSTPLHLMPLGQEELKNPESALKLGIQAVVHTVRGYPIQVYIHGRNREGVLKIKRILPEGLKVTDMTAAEFFAPSPPTPIYSDVGAPLATYDIPESEEPV